MRGHGVSLPLITHLLAAVLAAACAWGVQGWRLGAQIEIIKSQHSQQEVERHQVALEDARATFRKGEIHARNQQEIADAHAKQEKRRSAALAAALADGQRLRDQVAQFAAACGGGEADSPAVALQHCRDRAATLGALLGEADSLAEEFAGAAEQHADEVRTLMRVIQNDRTLLPPPGGLGIKAPIQSAYSLQPASGSTKLPAKP